MARRKKKKRRGKRIGRQLRIERLEKEIAVLKPKVARLEQQKAEASDRERYHQLRLSCLWFP